MRHQEATRTGYPDPPRTAPSGHDFRVTSSGASLPFSRLPFKLSARAWSRTIPSLAVGGLQFRRSIERAATLIHPERLLRDMISGHQQRGFLASSSLCIKIRHRLFFLISFLFSLFPFLFSFFFHFGATGGCKVTYASKERNRLCYIYTNIFPPPVDHLHFRPFFFFVIPFYIQSFLSVTFSSPSCLPTDRLSKCKHGPIVVDLVSQEHHRPTNTTTRP